MPPNVNIGSSKVTVVEFTVVVVPFTTKFPVTFRLSAIVTSEVEWPISTATPLFKVPILIPSELVVSNIILLLPDTSNVPVGDWTPIPTFPPIYIVEFPLGVVLFLIQKLSTPFSSSINIG